ncbi:unnamed protein product [Acanthocheilonema viteae]|uniref:Uncharacterized protein n=1 Tax=Acanthocheilonema viteae TaxID=6277 RepID=A0A498SYM3_ACAVI|nr:unnamed protein product [Acanthocheilonema viteae]
MELMDLSAPEVSEEELELYDSFVEEVRKGQRGSSNRPIQRVSAKRKLQSDVREEITDLKKRKMTSMDLERHVRTHTGERLHISRWNESFSDLSHLKNGTMNGIGGKPLGCLAWGKRFAVSFRLQTHNYSNERKVPFAEINRKDGS